jgi:hypothetical protein
VALAEPQEVAAVPDEPQAVAARPVVPPVAVVAPGEPRAAEAAVARPVAPQAAVLAVVAPEREPLAGVAVPVLIAQAVPAEVEKPVAVAPQAAVRTAVIAPVAAAAASAVRSGVRVSPAVEPRSDAAQARLVERGLARPPMEAASRAHLQAAVLGLYRALVAAARPRVAAISAMAALTALAAAEAAKTEPHLGQRVADGCRDGRLRPGATAAAAIRTSRAE